MAERQDNAFITVENIAHESTVWKQLSIFWEERQFCDIIVEAESKTFHCHSVILAAASQYFKTAIKSLKENEESLKLDVSNLSSSITLERVLHFIYTGKVLIPVENMENFLKESAHFETDSLQTAIDGAFTKDTVTDENAISLLVLSHNLNISSLKNHATNHICTNFENIVGKPKMLDVPFDIIKDVLSRDELNVKSEDVVLDFLFKWTEHYESKRVEILPEALKLVRLAFLSRQNAIQMIRHKTMKKSPAALDIAADLLEYLCEGKNPERLPPEVLTSRSNYQFMDSTILQEDRKLHTTLLDLLGDKVNVATNWKKCYTASENGFASNSFHTYCDNKGPTVVIIKANDTIFGGYTERDWNGNKSAYEVDNNGDYFIFSVTNKIKLSIKNRNHCIYNNMNYGPTFGGGHDIYIAANAHQNTSSYTNLGHSYETPAGMTYQTNQAKNFFAGSYNFICTEYEVYYNAKE